MVYHPTSPCHLPFALPPFALAFAFALPYLPFALFLALPACHCLTLKIYPCAFAFTILPSHPSLPFPCLLLHMPFFLSSYPYPSLVLPSSPFCLTLCLTFTLTFVPGLSCRRQRLKRRLCRYSPAAFGYVARSSCRLPMAWARRLVLWRGHGRYYNSIILMIPIVVVRCVAVLLRWRRRRWRAPPPRAARLPSLLRLPLLLLLFLRAVMPSVFLYLCCGGNLKRLANYCCRYVCIIYLRILFPFLLLCGMTWLACVGTRWVWFRSVAWWWRVADDGAGGRA